MSRTVADLLIERLIAWDVDTIFGFPGDGVNGIFEALRTHLGHLIDGTQAELVRVPFADNSLYRLPADVSDEAAIMLSDILPTGFEIGVRNGRVQLGDVVARVPWDCRRS
jgi:threonine dehydrogenase-like Zn-dependent dehydrogenase